MHEHPLTGLTAFGIVALLLGGLLLSPTPVLSVVPTPATRAALEAATPDPPKQIQPQPPVTGTREPPKATAEPPKTEPDDITRRVAEALGLKPEALTLVTVFQVTWSNSCLGCQQPGTECLQVLTPGEQRWYRDPDGREYDVRVGRNAQFLICAAPQQLTDSDSASPARPGTAEVAGESEAGAAEIAEPGDAPAAAMPATTVAALPSAPAAPTQAEQQLAAALAAPAAESASAPVAVPAEAEYPAEVVDFAPPSRGRIMAVVGGLWLLALLAVVANVWNRRQWSRA
ncbi:MAG: hypothetical protein BWY25_03082 [Chloroflexi bacterium ADurb.Bin222]|nr:MAG: hypothetical protein BWY25_03082 [Chloroflexi bacterium ADurb.Bin222]